MRFFYPTKRNTGDSASSGRRRTLVFSPLLLATAQLARADTSFPWLVKPPAAGMRLSPGTGIPVTLLFPKDAPQEVRVIQSNVLEQTQKSLFAPEGFEICDRAVLNGTCEQPTATGSGPSSLLIYLHPTNGAPSAGHFTGQLILASTLKPDGEAITLDFYTTTPLQRAAGVTVIFLSALFSWLISVWARNRYNRTQLLLPAAFARQRLFRICAVLGQAPGAVATDFPQTQNKVQELRERLDDAALENANYIPSSTPSPFGDPTLRVDDYRHFLAGVDAWLTILDEIVDNGLRPAWTFITPGQAPARVNLVAQAIGDLDKLVTGANAPDVAQVQSAVTARLVRLGNDMTAAAGPLGGGLPTPPAPRSFDSLRIELSRTSTLIWLATVVLTTLVGSYVAVISNPGFGIVNDYYTCLFWGLGLPTGASMLQQTAQSAYGALGVSVKK